MDKSMMSSLGFGTLSKPAQAGVGIDDQRTLNRRLTQMVIKHFSPERSCQLSTGVTAQNLLGNFIETPLQPGKINTAFPGNAFLPPNFEQLRTGKRNNSHTHTKTERLEKQEISFPSAELGLKPALERAQKDLADTIERFEGLITRIEQSAIKQIEIEETKALSRHTISNVEEEMTIPVAPPGRLTNKPSGITGKGLRIKQASNKKPVQ